MESRLRRKAGRLVIRQQSWTFVYSEYLDLPFALRRSGEAVVNARSPREAIDCLRSARPARIVVDMESYAAKRILALAAQHHPDVPLERHDQAIQRILRD